MKKKESAQQTDQIGNEEESDDEALPNPPPTAIPFRRVVAPADDEEEESEGEKEVWDVRHFTKSPAELMEMIHILKEQGLEDEANGSLTANEDPKKESQVDEDLERAKRRSTIKLEINEARPICPRGIHCQSNEPTHYVLYAHTPRHCFVLAKLFALNVR